MTAFLTVLAVAELWACRHVWVTTDYFQDERDAGWAGELVAA